MRIKLIARLKAGEKLCRGYCKEVELPFLPVTGMRFRQGISTRMWETEDGEISPRVKDVVYDLDEDTVNILFDIAKPLVSAFWTNIDPEKIRGRSLELSYFED